MERDFHFWLFIRFFACSMWRIQNISFLSKNKSIPKKSFHNQWNEISHRNVSSLEHRTNFLHKRETRLKDFPLKNFAGAWNINNEARYSFSTATIKQESVKNLKVQVKHEESVKNWSLYAQHSNTWSSMVAMAAALLAGGSVLYVIITIVLQIVYDHVRDRVWRLQCETPKID
jgi:hypothetical protein